MHFRPGSKVEPLTSRPLALVTGGAVRLGAVITRSLSAAGFRVAVHYHSSERLARDLAEELSRLGGDVATYRADLTRASECQRLVESVGNEQGPVEVLVNSAALFEPGSLHDTRLDAWSSQMNLNLRAPFLLTQHFAAQLPEGRTGSILNILDARLRRPGGDYLVYRSTKAALLHLTECLAVELAPDVRVNALAPGAILPHAEETREQMKARLGDAVPLGFDGSDKTLGRCAVELLTNPFLTGQITYLDGGQFL